MLAGDSSCDSLTAHSSDKIDDVKIGDQVWIIGHTITINDIESKELNINKQSHIGLYPTHIVSFDSDTVAVIYNNTLILRKVNKIYKNKELAIKVLEKSVALLTENGYDVHIDTEDELVVAGNFPEKESDLSN